MKSEILDKLQNGLNNANFDEIQVVYILSRIRKILEVDNRKGDYPVLNLYCNWALHSKLNSTSPIRDILLRVKDDINTHADFVTHIPFKKEFQSFLADYGLYTLIFDAAGTINAFNSSLIKIYSDTPLIVTTEKSILSITLSIGKDESVVTINIEEHPLK